MEPEVGFEPATFRLRVATHSSSRCQPGRSWLLRSAGSSIQCAPDLPRYGKGNDHWNDQPANDRTTRREPEGSHDRKVGVPRESTARPQTGERSGLLATQIGGHVVRPSPALARRGRSPYL